MKGATMSAVVAQTPEQIKARFAGQCNKWMDEHSDLIMQLCLNRKIGRQLDEYVAPIISSVSGLKITPCNFSYWRTKKANDHLKLVKFRRPAPAPKVVQADLPMDQPAESQTKADSSADDGVRLLKGLYEEVLRSNAAYISLCTRIHAVEQEMQEIRKSQYSANLFLSGKMTFIADSISTIEETMKAWKLVK